MNTNIGNLVSSEGTKARKDRTKVWRDRITLEARLAPYSAYAQEAADDAYWLERQLGALGASELSEDTEPDIWPALDLLDSPIRW